MTLNTREPQVGDGVILPSFRSAERLGAYTYDTIPGGTQFVITRVYSQRVQVRTIEQFSDGNGGWRGRSYTFYRDDLNYDDSVTEEQVVSTTGRRRLGKKPEDTEEMQYIGIDHPGIQWLFEDMGTFATEQGWCSQYDALVTRLGIPGRPRDFTVRREVGGIEMTAVVKARSQREANEMIERAILEGLTKEKDPHRVTEFAVAG
jgi:hypothetical protein